MTEALIVESLVAEQFILAGFVNIPARKRTTIALAKLNPTNRQSVLRSLQASVDAGRLKVVSGQAQLDGTTVHVHHIKRDDLRPASAQPERGRTAASVVQTDTGSSRPTQPVPVILTDEERKRIADGEAAKLEADKLALAEQEAADKKAADEKAEADRLAAEKVEADRLAAEKAEADRLAAEKAEVDRLAAAAANPPAPPAPPVSTTPMPPSTSPAGDL